MNEISVTLNFDLDDASSLPVVIAAINKAFSENHRLTAEVERLTAQCVALEGISARCANAENAAKALHALLAKALPELRDHAHNIGYTSHSAYVLWLTDKVKEAVLTDPLKAV